MYCNLLEGSDAETGLYEPCFCKADTHLPKEGLAPSTPFTYKLEEKRFNTKMIEQLIQNSVQNPKGKLQLSVRPMYFARGRRHQLQMKIQRGPSMRLRLMQRRLPRNGRSLLQLQLLMLQPSLHPQLLLVELPKVPALMRSRVLTMMNWTMMMTWRMRTQAAALASHRSFPKMRNLETLNSIPIHSAAHQVMGLLNIEVIIILTIRSPEVDPEVNLEADHLMDLAVLLPKVTEFILVTGLVPMTGAKIETTDQIVAHTTVMTKTDITPVMTGIVMTDTMTSTEADIMTGVMTGDMMTGV